MILNPTGKCHLPKCDNVATHGLYCCANHQQRATRAKRKEQKQKTPTHECHYTDGVCVQCENDKRRAVFSKNKRHYVNLTGFRHGSIVRR